MTRRIVLLVLVCFTLALLPGSARAADTFPLDAKRILFLGDSITHSGGYVAWIETQLRLQGVEPLPEIINIGLASETASGLSEPAHPFPRPDVHERLDRALTRLKPDVVVACYGMNDGIYYPLSEERFAAYREGINRLIEKAHDAGAKVILLTPPPFDPLPLRDSGKLKPAGKDEYAYSGMYENYNDVLTIYAKWIMQQADRVAMVIDINTALQEFIAQQRQSDPEFTHAGDGIHPGPQGHRIMGEAILRAWGISKSVAPGKELLKLVSARSSLLHDAYLTEVGHKRPGVSKGLPLEEALEKARQLDAKIQELLTQPAN
jgi:lysophospholipase L1-like esterase